MIKSNKTRTIAIANQKGGSGKTTTAVNLATALSMLNNKVLLLDLDPQAHTTLGLGFDPENFNRTMYDVIADKKLPLSTIITRNGIERLHLAPSNIMLSGAELELAIRNGREWVLKEKLQSLNGGYDYCIIDCSPSLSLLTLNALVASSDVIIPVQAHYYAVEGLKQLLETIRIVKQRFNPELKTLGVLLTFVESRTVLSRQIQRQLRDYFGDLVFDTVIHKTVRLAEAPAAGEPVLTYAPKSKGAAEYLALATEVTNGKA